MSIPEGYRLVSTDISRAREVLHVTGFAFGFTPHAQDAGFIDATYPWDAGRGIEVVDATRGTPGSLSAAHASFRFRMAVPGQRSLAVAGLTWVGVHPGHRRRGLLRAMIDDHFARSLQRGESVSVLYAAEAEIYQRFGYGLAAREAIAELGRGTKAA
ncbi:GNAT family N-acetyltransferase [Demequina litorisediminis]|uniref:N-acetyltransferase domain-containing protein n=1 Tax=Demequina litorisediminis TaxID=1849022 RepID=A0ABQ6II39_9MICO|nr:GNAT family N-acetyltransferase [Demequina litorisediminis]GMA36827.1 hypothetical protein GCM10025876_30310 [Demequina litorisediminis]